MARVKRRGATFFTLKKPDCPAGTVPVIHMTYESQPQEIFKSGIRPLCKLKTVKDYHKTSPIRIRRCSVYAFTPDRLGARQFKLGYGGRNYPICACVDPKTAMVGDMFVATGMLGAKSVLDTPDLSEKTRKEWQAHLDAASKDYEESMMTLNEYLTLSPEEREEKFAEPEVLIPQGIPPENLRDCAAPIPQKHTRLAAFLREWYEGEGQWLADDPQAVFKPAPLILKRKLKPRRRRRRRKG